MFLRFVVNERDEDSHCRKGVIHACDDLDNAGILNEHEHLLFREVMDWLNENLERPERLARSTKRHAHPAAICWYKDHARDHIHRMYDLCFLLEKYGRTWSMLKSMNPGYIVYEDDVQIAAVPFKTREV